MIVASARSIASGSGSSGESIEDKTTQFPAGAVGLLVACAGLSADQSRLPGATARGREDDGRISALRACRPCLGPINLAWGVDRPGNIIAAIAAMSSAALPAVLGAVAATKE